MTVRSHLRRGGPISVLNYPDRGAGLVTIVTAVTLTTGTGVGKWEASTRGNFQDESLGVEYDLATTLIQVDLYGTYLDSLGWAPFNDGGVTKIRFWNSTGASGTWPTCTYNVAITTGLAYVQYVWCNFIGMSTGSLQLAETSTVVSVPDFDKGDLKIVLDARGDNSMGTWDNGGAGGAGKISGGGNFSLPSAAVIQADLLVDIDDVNLPFKIYRYL